MKNYRIWCHTHKLFDNVRMYQDCHGNIRNSHNDGAIEECCICNPEQCTGLRDKKNVYMFENDIAIYQGTIVGFIQYGNGAFLFCSNEFEDTYMPLFEMYIEEECVVDLEIIGNIHTNPELMEN